MTVERYMQALTLLSAILLGACLALGWQIAPPPVEDVCTPAMVEANTFACGSDDDLSDFYLDSE